MKYPGNRDRICYICLKICRLQLQGFAILKSPFREAYKQVGMAVQRGEYRPTREVHHTHEGSIGNLCTAQIRRKMERVMSEFE